MSVSVRREREREKERRGENKSSRPSNRLVDVDVGKKKTNPKFPSLSQGLSKLLGDAAPTCRRENKFENYFGRQIAVDASMHIYQFLVRLF